MFFPDLFCDSVPNVLENWYQMSHFDIVPIGLSQLNHNACIWSHMVSMVMNFSVLWSHMVSPPGSARRVFRPAGFFGPPGSSARRVLWPARFGYWRENELWKFMSLFYFIEAKMKCKTKVYKSKPILMLLGENDIPTRWIIDWRQPSRAV